MAKSVERRLRDACFTAFMRGKEEHTDWMNDVLPMVDREIAAAIREDRAEMVSEAETIYETALERISTSQLHDMNTLHPEGCARLASAALEAARNARAG